MALDRTNWAGRRVPSLTRLQRSPGEALETACVAGILYYLNQRFGVEIDPVVEGVVVVVVAYFIAPLVHVGVQTFRAPTVEIQAINERLTERVAELEARVADIDSRNAFGVKLRSLRLRTAPGSDPLKFYVLVDNAVLTNATDAPTPFDVWLSIDITPNYSTRWIAKTMPPTPELLASFGEGIIGAMLPQVMTLPPREPCQPGYWIFPVSRGTLGEIAFLDATKVSTLPLFLVLRNLITDRWLEIPINREAEKAQARRLISRTEAPSQSQGV